MLCSKPVEVAIVVPIRDEVNEDEDFVEGIIAGLEDFAEGRYTVFESDDDLEAHLMSL